MKSLFKFLASWANLALLCCLFVLFNVLLNTFLPKDQALDLMFAYTAEEAYAAIGQLDTTQRQVYWIGIWALDMPYMVVYCLLFSGILMKIWKNRRVVALPLAIFGMDFFENLLVLRILNLYPTQVDLLVNAASFFTTGKWLLVGVLIVTVVVGLFSIVLSKIYLLVNSTGARI